MQIVQENLKGFQKIQYNIT